MQILEKVTKEDRPTGTRIFVKRSVGQVAGNPYAKTSSLCAGFSMQ